MRFLWLAMSVIVLSGVSGCGTKGGLKTPTEIAQDEAKAERRKAKEEARKAESSPSPQGEESGKGGDTHSNAEASVTPLPNPPPLRGEGIIVDYFQYKNEVYHAEEVSLEDIAREVGTPFYCYSSATLERHYKVFAGHFAGMDAKVCYAVKANGNLAVLKTLAKLGAGADVVSEGEIRLALAAGIAPKDIVFSGVGKTASEMRFALERDIFQFNVESLPELELLSETAAAMGKKARVAIRINPDVDPKTHAKISTGQKESKFGVAMSHALPVYRRAAELPGIEVQGVSVHIGSQLTSIEPFAEAFSHVRNFVLALRAEGIAIRTIDLGGGLGIPYGQDDPPVPDSYAQVVKQATADLDCQLIFEPGRLLVGNAGILVSRVLYVKRGENKTFVIVDAAMNDLLRPTLYDAYHEIVPVTLHKPSPLEGEGWVGGDTHSNAGASVTPHPSPPPQGGRGIAVVDVVGPVCETGDIFAENRKLPPLQSGDLLVFRTAGAYGASMANNYNARLLVPEVMVKGKDYAVVRPRQGYEELVGRDRLPGWLS